MKSFAYGLAAAALMAGTAFAQTNTPAAAPTTGTMASPMAAPGAMGSTMGTAPMAATPGSAASPGMAAAPTASGRAAASGNDNQAVATTTANAATPAHGANSFTLGEARRRIAARGFSSVANLRKDNSGVWRGMAQQNGSPVHVWLDYKGNVGQTAS